VDIIPRMAPKTRLDVALVERGLFESRARAQAAVLAGWVRVDGRPADKAGALVGSEVDIAVTNAQPYVSRAGTKLANALDHLGLDVTGARTLDLGASTGGFTDCLLQRGAAEVIALDVGYGQLAWSVRQDPRVTVMERTNARELVPGQLPFVPDLVTCDLSFISVRVVWSAVATCLSPKTRALVMVKPQFEVGREGVGAGGVVRDNSLRGQAVDGVARALQQSGMSIAGVASSGLAGPKGNREVFLLAGGPESGLDTVDHLDDAIAVACLDTAGAVT
jgi:23S rRNA (cytidine1920-2'-O)/16S rRNA (cytidine1409-2'-O)-methyltransferase